MTAILPHIEDSLNYQVLKFDNELPTGASVDPASDSTPTALSLTVIRSDKNVPVRKIVRLGREAVETISSYPRIKLWTRETHAIPLDIDALKAFIESLAQRPDAALVTGSPCGDLPLDKPARRLKADRDIDKATLAECSAPWLMVDADKIHLTERVDPLDPESSIASIVEMMGSPFTDTSYVWQLTASAMPGAERISVRLFFLVDKAINNQDRKAWAKSVNNKVGINLVDTSLFNAAQLIYTATPEFKGHDPFPHRIGVVYGESDCIRWDALQMMEAMSPEYQGKKHSGSVHRSITEWLDVIGDGEGKEGCHNPINQAIIQMVSHRWTADRIRAVIKDAVFSANWSQSRTQEYLKSETSDAKLNASIKGATRFVSITEITARVTQTRPILETIALPVAMIQAQEIVSRWVRGEGPDRLVLGLTVGSGKTHATVEAIKRDLPAGQNLVWAFPTHAQGAEVEGKLELEDFGSEFAIKIESRVRERDGAPPLCARPELIKAIGEAGLSSRTATIACKSRDGECPHYRGCEYYRQFRGEHRVRLVAHSTLKTPQARAINDHFMDNVAGLVIDESPIDTLLGRKSYILAEIQSQGGVIAEIVEMVRNDTHPETIDVPHLIERLEAERNERCVIEGLCHSPDKSDEWGLMQELRQRAETKRPGLSPLYHAAIAWLSGDKNLIWMGLEKVKDVVLDSVIVAWRYPMPEIKRVLVLDATPSEDAYRAILGDEVEIIRIDVEQNLEIFQAIDTPMGKGRLTNPENDGRLVQAVALARATGSGFISNKAANDLAKEKGYLPESYPMAHFNALRGLNSMESLESLVIAGRPEPDARDIEAKARALWPSEPLDLTGAYAWRTDGLASVASHQDSRCDGLLRMFREAEINQAIGRLRGVRSLTPKRVYVLTHTPVEIPGIKMMTLDQIVMPEGLSRLLIKTNGAAPLVPEIMTALLPDVWSSAKSASHFRDRLKTPFLLGKFIHKGFGVFKFRTRGQKRASTCLSFHDQFNTWELLERVIGIDVIECARTSAGEPPQKIQEPEHATDSGAWDSARVPDKPITPIRQKSPQKPATETKKAPTKQDSLRVFERAWWASGTPIKNDYPYISASALGQLLSTDRRSDRTREIVVPLLDVGLIESLESGYIVKDNVQASAWMLAMT